MAWANGPACGAFGTLGLAERVEVLTVRAVGLAAGQDRLGEPGPGALRSGPKPPRREWRKLTQLHRGVCSFAQREDPD